MCQYGVPCHPSTCHTGSHVPSVPYTYIDSVSKWNSTRPRTMILLCKATLLKVLAIGGDNFTEYILCPKCDSIYSPEYCKRVGMFAATACPYKAYPNHPHVGRRTECGASLLKTVRLKSGLVYIQTKIFPCQSIKKAITKLAQETWFCNAMSFGFKEVPLIGMATCAVSMMEKYGGSITTSCVHRTTIC